MAASTRHLHRHNLADAADPATNEEPLLSRALGGRAQPNQRRASTAVGVDDLSDEKSEMARFLLMGNGQGSRGWFWRFRHNAQADNENNVDGRTKSMGTFASDAYSLALEPIEIGSEKVVVLSEAYAIFGGLFLNGTWILYEWGIGSEGADELDEYYKRSFAAVMAIAICCNIFLALWSSVLWIMAIVYGSREGFAFQARKFLAFCNALLSLTLTFVIIGVGEAVFHNLSPNWPEFTIVTVIVAYLNITGMDLVKNLDVAASPLGYYHKPAWYRAISHPTTVFTHKGRKTLRERAKAEAEKLKCRAYGNSSETDDQANTSMYTLLRTAAKNLGRHDHDVSIYVARLREDWLSDVEQLKNRSAECLSRYMPLLLAEEVHRLVEEKKS